MELEIRAVLEGISPHSSNKDRPQERFWRERKVKSQQSMEIMSRAPTLNCQCSQLFSFLLFPTQPPTCLFPSEATCSKTKIASFVVSVFISAGYMHHTTTELSHFIHSGMTIVVWSMAGIIDVRWVMLGSYRWGWIACLMDATNHSTMCWWRMEPTDMLLKVWTHL